MLDLASALVGFGLGAWLIVAAVRKLVQPDAFAESLATLFRVDASHRRIRVIGGGVPWIEVAVGVSACLAYDTMWARASVLTLFTLFFLLILVLAFRFTEFDCGCFGAGHKERREIVLVRSAAGLVLALGLFVLPTSRAVTPFELLRFQCAAWSLLVLALVIRQAGSLNRDGITE